MVRFLQDQILKNLRVLGFTTLVGHFYMGYYGGKSEIIAKELESKIKKFTKKFDNFWEKTQNWVIWQP
jgi:RNA binding exosome subunit